MHGIIPFPEGIPARAFSRAETDARAAGTTFAGDPARRADEDPLVARDPIYFRKSIDGIAAICSQQFERDPFTGSLDSLDSLDLID